MKEVDVRRKIYRLARELGYWPITNTDTSICPRCKAKVKPTIGRPDILWLHPSASSRVCEIKVLRQNETSFPFERITPEQRTWLSRWLDAGGLGYLALGIIRPAGQRTRLARLYLVPWAGWLVVEGLVSQYQESIPLTAGKGTRKALQENHLDIVTLLAPWELTREPGRWLLPPDHSAIPQGVDIGNKPRS